MAAETSATRPRRAFRPALAQAVQRLGMIGEALHLCRSWLGPVWKRLLVVLLLGLAMAAAEAVTLVVIANVLLAFAGGHRAVDLDMIGLSASMGYGAAGIAATAGIAISTALRLIEAKITAALSAQAVDTARRNVLFARLGARWEDVRDVRLGDLQRLLGTNAVQAALPILLLTTYATAGLAALAYVGVVILAAPMLVAVGVAIGVVVVFVFRPLRRNASAAASDHAASLATLQLEATTYIASHRELEGFGVVDRGIRLLGEHSRVTASNMGRVRFYARGLPPLYQQLMLLGLLVGVLTAKAVGASADGVGASALLLLRALSYVQTMNNITQSYVEGRPFLQELRDAGVAQRRAVKPMLSDEAAIVLDDVSYEYVEGQPVIDSLSLRLEAGERVAVTGSSGGGKSTLLGLIAGTLTPSTGLVRLPRASAHDERPGVAQVHQDPTLLRGSIADNVRFHRAAEDSEVARALSMAGLSGEIADLPVGTDTVIGDGASPLSGGQRQRLAIARALLHQPLVLLLDEPSSALDEANEAALVDVLDHLDPTITVVIVTHRPALLSICTRQIVVDGGEVVADRSLGGSPARVGGRRRPQPQG